MTLQSLHHPSTAWLLRVLVIVTTFPRSIRRCPCGTRPGAGGGGVRSVMTDAAAAAALRPPPTGGCTREADSWRHLPGASPPIHRPSKCDHKPEESEASDGECEYRFARVYLTRPRRLGPTGGPRSGLQLGPPLSRVPRNVLTETMVERWGWSLISDTDNDDGGEDGVEGDGSEPPPDCAGAPSTPAPVLFPCLVFGGRRLSEDYLSELSLLRHGFDSGVFTAQLTDEHTRHVDDKLLLWSHLREAASTTATSVMPPTLVFEDLVAMFAEGGTGMVGESAQGNGGGWDLCFVKHRYGCKGQSVYVLPSLKAAHEWLEPRTNRGDFVVQMDVGKIWSSVSGSDVGGVGGSDTRLVVRAHVLLSQRSPQNSTSTADANNSFEVYLHRDLICQEYEGPTLSSKGSPPGRGSLVGYVSSRHVKKRTSEPFLLADRCGNVYNEVFPQLQGVVRAVHDSVKAFLEPGVFAGAEWSRSGRCDSGSLEDDSQGVGAMVKDGRGCPQRANGDFRIRWYHLFGYDFMLTTSGMERGGESNGTNGAHANISPMLLEINSNPAIASGTMRYVDRDVYDRLLVDTFTVLGFDSEGEASRKHDFIPCLPAPPLSK